MNLSARKALARIRRTPYALPAMLILAAVGVLTVAALARKAGKTIPQYLFGDALAEVARVFLFGFALALAALVGGVAFLGWPLWLAVAVAGGAFVATGAYSIAAESIGLPALPGSSSSGGAGAGSYAGQVIPIGCPVGYVKVNPHTVAGVVVYDCIPAGVASTDLSRGWGA